MPAISHAPKPTRVTVELRALEHWRGEKRLFADLDFQLKAPVLFLAGANGSGKTSLLKVLCHLSLPEHGEVIWQQDGTKLSTAEAMANIAYTGHRDGLNPNLSVLENLRWGVALNSASQSIASLDRLLQQHDLIRLRDQTAASLSAGQRRRVALLRSVACGCAVWVWDEPYANLDRQGRLWVDQLINTHIAHGGTAIVSTHQTPTIDTHLMQTLELGA